jgi:hypothetical protein
MRLPHPSPRTVGLLLAAALVLLIVGMLIKGVAYLLVAAAVVLAGWALVSARSTRDGPTG